VIGSLDGNVFTPTRRGKPKWGARAWMTGLSKLEKVSQLTGEQGTVLIQKAEHSPAGPWRDLRDEYGFYLIREERIQVSPGATEILIARLSGTDSLILPDGRVAPRAKYPNGFTPGTWEPVQPPAAAFPSPSDR